MARSLDDIADELLGRTTRRDKIHTPAKLHKPVKPVKPIYFDAERFRFYFHKREGRTLHQWRELIDAEMRKAEIYDAETP